MNPFHPVRGCSTLIVILVFHPAWAEEASLIPPHEALGLEGLHAYPDRESVAAGETIRFHVSSQVPYRFKVTRLGLEIDDRSSDLVIFEAPDVSPRNVQPIHPGSYIHVERSLPADVELRELTLECWVRPWSLERCQGILAQHDSPSACGYGLFLDDKGKLVFSVGHGGELERRSMLGGPKLELQKWHHVVATWDGSTQKIWLNGVQAASWEAPEDLSPRRAGPSPIAIGAFREKGVASHFLDGDIAMPTIYARALRGEEIRGRFETGALEPPDSESGLACWPLTEEKGVEVKDIGRDARHGRIINRGTWMIGGPSFDGAAVPRYGRYDPSRDRKRGHGLRLASDDLYDCRWKSSREFLVPADARSGIHAAWFEFELDEIPHRYPVTFIVRKAESAPRAPIALLSASATWRAYNSTPFARNVPEENRFWGTKGQAQSAGDPPAYSMYRDHRAGQPSYQVGLRVPWPVAGPGVLYSLPGVGYSHLMRGERFTHAWLEKEGYGYDVYTSLDLHRDPGLLNGYRAFIINGHDEYWSVAMYRAVERYLKGGGHAIVLSGNTMFWRVSFDDAMTVMECRKFQSNIGGRTHATVGEIYHSHDGKRGSLMRNCGYPAWRLIGLECGGWWGTQKFGAYEARLKSHFLFNSPEVVELGDDLIFGDAPGGGLPRAGGHEGDVRLSSLPDLVGPVPEGAVLPPEPEGIVTLASMARPGQRVLDYFTRWTTPEKATFVEMIYWERPDGGQVFNAGVIGSGWALSADPELRALLRNVLHHFGVPAARR